MVEAHSHQSHQGAYRIGIWYRLEQSAKLWIALEPSGLLVKTHAPLLIVPYSDAQREKFNQLYKISDTTDFEDTVIRLVDLVQNSLFIFGLFKLSDVDGLLCNATEKGLDEFYNTFLSSKFQVQLYQANDCYVQKVEGRCKLSYCSLNRI